MGAAPDSVKSLERHAKAKGKFLQGGFLQFFRHRAQSGHGLHLKIMRCKKLFKSLERSTQRKAFAAAKPHIQTRYSHTHEAFTRRKPPPVRGQKGRSIGFTLSGQQRQGRNYAFITAGQVLQRGMRGHSPAGIPDLQAFAFQQGRLRAR